MYLRNKQMIFEKLKRVIEHNSAITLYSYANIAWLNPTLSLFYTPKAIPEN